MTQDRFKELQRMLTVQNELVRFQAVVILQEHMHEALKTREGLSWLRWSMSVLSESRTGGITGRIEVGYGTRAQQATGVGISQERRAKPL